jgi:hypothetical protein
MNNKNYRVKLEKAIKFAGEAGTFSLVNAIKRSKNICVFGLGKFFNEAFEQQKVRENLGVTVLCDNDSNKWGKIFNGLKCISPFELTQLHDPSVIIMVGNPEPVQKQLLQLGLRCYNFNEVGFELFTGLPRNKDWFKNNNRIVDVFNLLDDDLSKKVYFNIICNRIAPHFAECTYQEIYSDGEYFGHGLFNLTNNESFVDCGAWTGDTIIAFLNSLKDIWGGGGGG